MCPVHFISSSLFRSRGMGWKSLQKFDFFLQRPFGSLSYFCPLKHLWSHLLLCTETFCFCGSRYCHLQCCVACMVLPFCVFFLLSIFRNIYGFMLQLLHSIANHLSGSTELRVASNRDNCIWIWQKLPFPLHRTNTYMLQLFDYLLCDLFIILDTQTWSVFSCI